jgi:hypothetical protein
MEGEKVGYTPAMGQGEIQGGERNERRWTGVIAIAPAAPG